MTITVVITSYNQGHFLDGCLDSVKDQTRLPDEIILVDDGSSDGTAGIVHQWSQSRRIDVRLVRQANAGTAAARNAGVRRAQSDLIALLDADDLFQPNHLAALERAFEHDFSLAACFGDAKVLDGDVVRRSSFLAGKAVDELRFDEGPGQVRFIRSSVYESLLRGSYIPICSALFRRELAEKIGGFDETLRFREDADFWLRLSLAGPFAYVRLPLATIRRHSSNKSHPRNAVRYLPQKLKLFQKLVRRRRELGLSDREAALTKEAAARLAPHLLYTASKAGFGEYARALVSVVGFVPSPLAFHPRHLVRAVYCSLSAAGKSPHRPLRRPGEV